MATEHTVPNPGSPDAVARGCTCPVRDNRAGQGAGVVHPNDVFFWVTEGCPLHPAVTRPPTTEIDR